MKLSAVVLIAISVFMIGVGVYGGADLAVFHKAVLICLECIGIG